jgi:hypothetical protein
MLEKCFAWLRLKLGDCVIFKPAIPRFSQYVTIFPPLSDGDLK